jgi:MFS family permease
VSWERRCRQPLVSIRMLSHRPVLFTNLATIFAGMGLYFAFLGLMQFVQIPHAVAGYGFGASVLEASVVYQLPGAAAGFVAAVVSGRFINRFGGQAVLIVSAIVGLSGYLLIALAHSQPWHLVTGSILMNAYISLAYGALPALVVAEVDAGQTGVATSMNAISRTVGSSIAAAIVAALLSSSSGKSHVPLESSFTAVFFAGAVTAVSAMVLIALSRTRKGGLESAGAQLEARAMNHEWG